MKNKLFILLFYLTINTVGQKSQKFITLFETSKGTETPTYPEVISFYETLASECKNISLFTFGETDAGFPLHLVVYNSNKITDVNGITNSTKIKVLINNGIHPGESDGIDASMLLLRDIAQSKRLQKKYKNTIICIIPVYNIGGALNRNSYTRANQNGPKSYGFRGNAKNYDLNRDFIKQDSKNAVAFSKIFHTINPEIFIDNHVSNGANYQYAITHLFTQHNKLGGKLGAFLEYKMRPFLETSLEKKKIPITPYVNVWGSTPEHGFSQFYDSPRYSTGYTTLFNTLGLMVETHMLKPYKIRVEQTYELLFSMLDFSEENSAEVKQLIANAVEEIQSKKKYPILFKVDSNNPTKFQFKGYEADTLESKVTTGKRLFYDETKPFTKEINYYNNFKTTKEIDIPKAYILSQSWHSVIERLEHNNIQFTKLKNDTVIQVEVNHISDYKTRNVAYEGHYLHYNTATIASTKGVSFRKGDLYIPTNQKGIRYLLETLEAEAVDSFFNWNFFDTILQQKEHFSAYVFEDIAEQLLTENSSLQKKFVEQMKDSSFAKNPSAQLEFIYKNSPHFEKSYLRLPVYKLK
jgi:hypothetical protein